LDGPGYPFVNAFAFEVGIIRQATHLLLYLALHFVNLARNLILGTWFHLGVSFEMI
jgi:hypothetical protein